MLYPHFFHTNLTPSPVLDIYNTHLSPPKCFKKGRNPMFSLNEEQVAALQVVICKKNDDETQKSIADFDKALDVAVSKLVADGWTLPAELPISAVYALGKTSKLDDVNAFMVSFYLSDDCQKTRAMIKGIQNSKVRPGLIKVVNECWQAFEGKMYAVCAISLIAVIEGILSEFSDNKEDTKMKKVCQKHVDTYPQDGSTILKHVWISYNHFIRKMYDKSPFTGTEPTNTNRHWLLHGRSAFEICESDCVKLFNAVHSLCMIINEEAKHATNSNASS